MKIWLLELKKPGGFDVVNTMVVRAYDARSARRIASGSALAEGPDAWTKPVHSSCRALGTSKPGALEVVCREYVSG